MLKPISPETKPEEFSHIGLDVTDPSQMKLWDAYNKYKKFLSKKSPQEFTSIEDLDNTIKNYLSKLETQYKQKFK